jgi:hypothetical protein
MDAIQRARIHENIYSFRFKFFFLKCPFRVPRILRTASNRLTNNLNLFRGSRLSCPANREAEKRKKDLFMKKSKLSIVLFAVALLFASSAFAGDTNKGTLNLSQTVSVEGKTLNPGEYKVQWTGTGSAVQVSILQGKQTIATFPAQLTEHASRNNESAYGSVTQPDGTRALTSIYIGGKHAVLEVDRNAISQQSSAQGSH